MKTLFLGLLFLIISPLFLISQTPDYYKLYMDTTGSNSVLYRGNAPVNYHFKHEGSYYIFDENFQKGEVFFNGRRYTGILINLNSHTDELIVKIPESISTVIANKTFVQKFNFHRKLFINFSSKKKGAPQAGYYELLYGGRDTLMKKIRKVYIEQIPQGGSGSIVRIFRTDESYHIYSSGVWKSAYKKRDLLKIYSKQRREIVKHLKEAGADFSINKEQAFIEVVKFAEKLNQAAR